MADLVGVAVADKVGGTGVNKGDGVGGTCDWLMLAVGVGGGVGDKGESLVVKLNQIKIEMD